MSDPAPERPAGARRSGRAPTRDGPLRVLVLCTGNSARSQIAEALLQARGAGRFTAASAGSHPATRVHPEGIAVLGAHGIVWDGHTPQGIDDVAGLLAEGERFDLVITVCDDAREACPYFPGAVAQVHWGLPDPARVADPAARQAFVDTYAALTARVDALLALPLEALDAASLRAQGQTLHDGRAAPADAGEAVHVSNARER